MSENPKPKRQRGRPKLSKVEQIQKLEEQLKDHKTAEQMLTNECELFKSVQSQYPIITDIINEALEDLKEEIEHMEQEKADLEKQLD